ncbi:hypothetical protein E1262_05115 [Jiangella aurantiaca]|uniref:Uncharacterized protein n=1 Tax=Jiangella aurantiaca TaxID=2530373 RepID=A0A4V2YSW5_9ACTN|nr:hypothetical protein [Jiangella aurantiaca]TDD71537.1 hypothetical protein E1262_05115 [Jiangella aurantiaca]
MTLRTRLDDLAADAPDPGVLDVDRLRGRIARRRRTRFAAAGAAAILTVAAVGTATATLLPRDGGDDSADLPVSTSDATPAQVRFRALTCGSPMIVSERDDVPPLALSVDVPSVVGHIDEQLAVTTVTNVSATRIQGTTGLGPTMWVTRDGETVTAAAFVPEGAHLVDLEPGESMTFDTTNHIGWCGPTLTSGLGEVATAPGSYQLWFTWRMTTLDGEEIVLYEGPVDVEVE